jgi:hypothetical protein
MRRSRRVKRSRRNKRRNKQRTLRRKQRGGESSVDMPLGSIVIKKDPRDPYSPFLAADLDTASNELSASSDV